ncbi:hypothetical protein [Neobacillus jeddahensis]|uniref:hypothetical protein n=1 Tax=Neobacillus jeddahensis TaxID=1461580 RepID=UPI000590B409|nr:hypothetical protein [Neobacillus jeddahensis]
MFKVAIENLFNQLYVNKIPYLIERNYEMLPDNVENDLDLLIEYKNLQKVKGIIDFVLTGKNYYKVLDGFSLGTNKLIYVNNDQNLDLIRLDLNYMFHYLGIEYLDIEIILNRRIKNKNFYIPHKKDELIMSLFTNYINNGQVKEKYKAFIKSNLDIVSNYDALYIKEEFINTLLKFISVGDWSSVNKFVTKVRRNIVSRNFLLPKKNKMINLLTILIKRLYKSNNILIQISQNEYSLFIEKAKRKGMKCIDISSTNRIKMFLYKRFNGNLFIKLK